MLFRFGNFSIDVDVERTRKYYAESSRTLTEGCDCILCQNFRAAYESLDTEIKRFFDNLGVDILKAADMTTMHADAERNILYYDGVCHLCGSMVDGSIEKHCDQPLRKAWHHTPQYVVNAACTVYFTTNYAMVEKSFPDPVLQMEVAIEIPWVLGGKFTDTLQW